MIHRLAIAALVAAPILGASVLSADESAPVHYRATQWAYIAAGAHVAETFALVVYDGADSDTLDYGLSLFDCLLTRALMLQAPIANEFACVAERST